MKTLTHPDQVSLFDLPQLPDLGGSAAPAPRSRVVPTRRRETQTAPAAEVRNTNPSSLKRTKLTKAKQFAVDMSREEAVVTLVGDVITIRFAAPAKIMSTNTRSGWRAEGNHRGMYRDLMFDIAGDHDLPTGWSKARIDVLLQFPRGGKRDNANFHALVAKPLVDALGPDRVYTIHQGKRKGEVVTDRGHGLLLGDDTDRLCCGDCPHIRFGDPTGVKNAALPFGQITVTVTNLSAVASGLVTS